MAGVTRLQTRILRRQIRKIYGTNFIPVLVPTAPISIGDILISPKDFNAIVDSSEFPSNLIKSTNGPKNSINIVSSNMTDLSVKARGEGSLSEYFQLGEAGIAVNFKGENEMFLKLNGTSIQTIRNLPEFRNYILKRYVDGSLNAKVYIVNSLIRADKYFLQFSGQQGGTLVLDLKVKPKQTNIQVNSDFNFKWSNRVGYSIDGSNGGVLGYKVSAVRLNGLKSPNKLINHHLMEADGLSLLSSSHRQKLVETELLEISDVTNELVLEMEDELD